MHRTSRNGFSGIVRVTPSPPSKGEAVREGKPPRTGEGRHQPTFDPVPIIFLMPIYGHAPRGGGRLNPGAPGSVPNERSITGGFLQSPDLISQRFYGRKGRVRASEPAMIRDPVRKGPGPVMPSGMPGIHGAEARSCSRAAAPGKACRPCTGAGMSGGDMR